MRETNGVPGPLSSDYYIREHKASNETQYDLRDKRLPSVVIVSIILMMLNKWVFLIAICE